MRGTLGRLCLTLLLALPWPGRADEMPLTESALHDYLIAHPELLQEMSRALQKRQQQAHDESFRQALPAARADLFDDPRDGVAGNPHGDVTVVVFQDKECPYCKALSPDLQRLIREDGGVRIVYKEFPILGAGSLAAAKATLAAIRQGKFGRLHDALMADKTPEHQLSEAHILTIAAQLGLDVVRLRTDMAAPAIERTLGDTQSLAMRLGIVGTPGVVIGHHLDSYLPYERLQERVAEARGKGTAGMRTD